MQVSVPVRNISKTNVIISSGKKEDAIEWSYFDSPDGRDFQEVPEEVWGSTRMRAARNRGILAEASIEEMEAAFTRQREARDVKQANKDEEVKALISKGDGNVIRIGEDELNAHIEASSHQRPTSLTGEVMRKAEVHESRAPGTTTTDVIKTL